MSLYDAAVFVHLAAAVGLLSGSVVGSPAVRAAVRRAQTLHELRAYLTIGRPLHVLEPASAVTLLVTGIYLTSAAGFWTLGWVQVAVVAWVINAAVAGLLVKPIVTQLAAHAAVPLDSPVGTETDALRRSRRWTIGGDILLANDAATLFIMSVRPELAGSLLAVAGVNALVFGARAVWPARRPGVPALH